MRCTTIKTSLEILVPTNNPDGNGVIYTEEAIINACKNANNLPIIIYNSKGESVVIGSTSNVRYEKGHILVDGYINAGGTTESVLFNDNKEIVSMEISGFGFGN